jgi:hypothetical protein
MFIGGDLLGERLACQRRFDSAGVNFPLFAQLAPLVIVEFSTLGNCVLCLLPGGLLSLCDLGRLPFQDERESGSYLLGRHDRCPVTQVASSVDSDNLSARAHEVGDNDTHGVRRTNADKTSGPRDRNKMQYQLLPFWQSAKRNCRGTRKARR